MDRKLRFGVVVILALASFSCATTVVPKPGEITLEAAMTSVGKGLIAMRKAQGGLRTGLIADDVEVTFNISASGEQGGSLMVEMTPVPTAPLFGGAKGELSTRYTAQRGNQITIKFKNIMTCSTNTMIDDIEKLKNMVDYIKSQKEPGPIGK